jgi:hypothetical protein
MRVSGRRVSVEWGKKKPSDSLTVFREFRVCLYALSPLSIRQRSEMPKEIKVKLGGHGERGERLLLQKGLSGFIPRVGSIDKPQPVKMRGIRTLSANFAESVRMSCRQTVPPTVIRSMRSVGWPTPTGTL